MTTGKKVALVVGIAVGLVLVLIVAAWITWRRIGPQMIQQGQRAMTEGRALGRTATAAQCVDSILVRHARAPVGFANTVVQSLYFKGCLDTGSELSAVCAQNTGTGVFSDAARLRGMCQAHGQRDQYCSTVLQPLLEACRRRAPSGSRS